MKFVEVFGNAKYVKAKDGYQFPYIRKNFFVKKAIKSATVTVSVLGFCELYLNGKKLTDDLYVFPYTQYNKQSQEDVGYSTDPFFDDDIRYTIGYVRFDVREFLTAGDNAFGVIVAGGWYRSGFDKHGGYRNYGDTKTCFRIQIEYTDGETEEVLSGEDCRYQESFLTEAGIFHEEHDERKEIVDFSTPSYDDSAWGQVVLEEAPFAEYRENDCPQNKIIRFITPTLIKRTDEYAVYDVGENTTGYAVLRAEGVPCGAEIGCQYSEVLDEGNEINEFHSYSQISRFISDGRKEHFIRFTWHGFRYFKVWSSTGEVSCERCAVVHADVKNTSRFDSDNEILNWIYTSYVNSQQQNYQCGLPTDCPQIERKGYTGDGQLLADLGMMLFDSKRLYKKWMQDISDCQDRKSGFVHHTAPCFVGCGGGPGGWGIAIINVPYAYYRAFGDKEVLSWLYPQMKEYLRFMKESSRSGLVERRRKGWCLGDWESPRGRDGLLPPPFVNTCFYIIALKTMTEIAGILGEEQDIDGYQAEIQRLIVAVNKQYYNSKTGDYCDGDQGANAIALKAGLGDARTAQNLANRYDDLQEFDTGIFATKLLIEQLCETGNADVALKMLTSKKECSYYTWMSEGATTLYESWKNARSHNHPMFGSVVQYFFQYFLGITQGKDSCAYEKIYIRPVKVKGLNRVNGSLQTAAGEISVSAEYTENGAKFIVNVPKNTKAEFVYGEYIQALNAGETVINI